MSRLKGALNRGESGATTAIALLALSTFLVSFGLGLTTPVLPQHVQALGGTASTVGLIIATSGCVRVAINIPAGRVSERFGRKPLMNLGSLALGAGEVVLGSAPGVFWLFVGIFLAGLGSAVRYTAAMTAVADVSGPANTGRSMSLFAASVMLGSTLGPAAGGAIAQVRGTAAAFYVHAVAVLLSLLLVAALPETRGWMADGASAVLGARTVSGERAVPDGQMASGTRASSGPDAAFWLASLVSFGVYFTNIGGLATVWPMYARSRWGMSPAKIGLSMAIASGAQLVSVYPSGWLFDRTGHKKLAIVPGAILTGAALALMAVHRSWSVGAALLGIGRGLIGGAPSACAAERASPESRGQAMGLFQSVTDAGWLLGPLVLGYASDAAGPASEALPLFLNAGLMVALGVLFAVGEVPGRGRSDQHGG